MGLPKTSIPSSLLTFGVVGPGLEAGLGGASWGELGDRGAVGRSPILPFDEEVVDAEEEEDEEAVVAVVVVVVEVVGCEEAEEAVVVYEGCEDEEEGCEEGEMVWTCEGGEEEAVEVVLETEAELEFEAFLMDVR